MNADLDRAASIMTGFHGMWGVAGGWAIDLFLGRQTRAHADVDVAILRDDQHYLRAGLTGGRAQKVIEHTLIEWLPDERLEPPVHEIHATWPDGYHLEILLN